MPPKQKRAQPPSTFRPSAATLSAFQMRAAASAHAPRRPRRPRARRTRRGPKANPKRRRARARGLFRGGRRSARVPSAREPQTPLPRPREDGEQLAPQISEGAPQPMNATYSAECRAVNSDPHFVPGPAQPVRKEVRPSSGRFWATFAKSAKAKMPSLPGKKKVWSPKAPPPPPPQRAQPKPAARRRNPPKPPKQAAEPPPFKAIGSSFTPPGDVTFNLADLGKFQRDGSRGSSTGDMGELPIADVSAVLPETNSGLFSFGGSNNSLGRVPSIDLRHSGGPRPGGAPGSPSYFDRASHDARRSWALGRDSSFMTLNSDTSQGSFLGARQSMNLGGLTPRDSRTWAMGSSGANLTHDRDLQLPPDFKWETALAQGDGDGMDMDP